MNTTSSPENKGIIGPTPDDIKTFNKLTGPIKKSRWLGAVAGILGIPLATSALAACASPKAAIVETTPVSDSDIKVIPVSVNPEAGEQIKPEVKYYPIEARDPVDPLKRVSFQFVETKLPSGSEYGVMFADKIQREYKTALTQDSKDRKFHIEYTASAVDQEEKGLSFIDFELQLDSQTNETPEQTGQRALQAWEKGQISKVTLRDQKNSITYTVKKDRNLLQQVLSLFPVRVALAEELEEPQVPPDPDPEPDPTKVVPDTKPTVAPATPEAPKEVSCPILSPEFCSKAEVIDWTNPDGEKSKLVGFKLPAGTPILMPIEGNVSRGQLPETSPMQGFQVTVSDPKNPNPYWYRFYGNIEWITPSPHEKGKAFARIGTTGITNAGGYDLLVAVHQGIGMNTVRAEDELRRMFPSLDFDNPSHKASARAGSGGGTIYTTGYYEKPPAWLNASNGR